MTIPSRRLFILGGLALPSCTALSALNEASVPRDTYELMPLTGRMQGLRSRRTLLVLEPTAPAAIATDRILIKPDPLSVTYLPDVRWADEVPRILQNLLIRSLSESGRIGFVGEAGSGPIPDYVLLTRIDSFHVDVAADQSFTARIAFELTLLRDRDQSVQGTQRFRGETAIANDQASTIVQALQQLMDTVLADAVGWTAGALQQ